MTLNLTTFGDRDALMHATASRIADCVQNAVKRRGAACVALSGGSTPEPAYRLLAAMPLDWENITFALVDERFVPLSDPGSNEAMLERALAPAFAAGADIKPLYFATQKAAQAAASAEAIYAPLAIDIAVMGMGEDGHTASWFPGAQGLDVALDIATRESVVAIHAPQATFAADRITLTRAAYNRADQALLVITGSEKRRRLDAAFTANPADLPVAALFAPGAPPLEVVWAP